MKKILKSAAAAMAAMLMLTGCGSADPIVGTWDVIGTLDGNGNRVEWSKSDLDSAYSATFNEDKTCTVDIDGTANNGNWDVDASSTKDESDYSVVIENDSMKFYIKSSNKNELYGASGDKTLIFGKEK